MSSKSSAGLDEAIERFDRTAALGRVHDAAKAASEIRSDFPLASWTALPLERYALGHSDYRGSFCHRLEFASPELGSIRGGSSKKLIIHGKADGSGWYHDPAYADVHAAWEQVRAGFVSAFDLASRGKVAEVDDIAALRSGPALTTKALYIYFPDQVLPIYSQAHVRHFTEGLSGGAAAYLAPLAANRRLLELTRSDPRFAGWDPMEVMLFLYSWADPRAAPAVVKIAPGERARFWPECRAGGFICVGWDEVGDLSGFADEDEFRAAFATHHPYNGNESTVTRKAREVWRLTELQPGDRVVANEGQSRILAVGTVTEPGYQWRPERSEYRHTVTVDWDESFQQTLAEPVKAWGVTTVAPVTATLWRKIAAKQPGMAAAIPAGPAADTSLPLLAAPDRHLQQIGEALTRKGQVVLFGPPGTGKTYTAMRFATWWLARSHPALDPLADYGTTEFWRVFATLSTAAAGSTSWWMTANPNEWSWSALFADGSATYRRGRLARNYERIKPGDLVFCYETAPTTKVVGLAKVTSVDGTTDQPVTLRPLARIADGPTWHAISQDSVLAGSEPVLNRSQGTLFALTSDEAQELAKLALLEPNLVAELGKHQDVGQLTQVTFHPSYGYEDFIEGFKPVPTALGGLHLRLVDGIFKQLCRAATADPDRPYLLLIDEINRGNVPKILGELITLLELDKRGVEVRLPQSGETFSVPKNVYILGTMNTADRSIRLLDAALRRRFAFYELLPDPEPLEGAYVGQVHLADLLTALNARVRTEVGRDRQVGHAFLLRDGRPLTTEEDLAAAIRYEVIPLLQEYAYDDYTLLARLIGPQIVDLAHQRLRDLTDPDLVDALYTAYQAGTVDQ